MTRQEEGFFCPHGLAYNFCEICKQERPLRLLHEAETNLTPEEEHTRLMQIYERGFASQRQVFRIMHDGNTTVTVESKRPKPSRSGRLYYQQITPTMKLGHYFKPVEGRPLGIAMDRSWEKLSYHDLNLLLAGIVCARRRKKLRQGKSTKYLLGPTPATIHLSRDLREIVDDLQNNLSKSDRFPERKRPRV